MHSEGDLLLFDHAKVRIERRVRLHLREFHLDRLEDMIRVVHVLRRCKLVLAGVRLTVREHLSNGASALICERGWMLCGGAFWTLQAEAVYRRRRGRARALCLCLCLCARRGGGRGSMRAGRGGGGCFVPRSGLVRGRNVEACFGGLVLSC